ncbi:solute carrier family 40 member 3, chloroplastic isoform X3 [Oryza glaberrima]|uniref:solute carrier family 40 member 3, chloroplastic isoform X3 n=1 Tax=Oryza glaberrima TaxID=4538 RepID=UPI00224C2E4E|nr:solute carrier family 40 member 3, chloroplastic isoform X3 [Oryza glaberrima]XP_052154411.1 solute carrier family 40 member 3, chloroplastic isoform X3 [Oryza glaberrima]XP_052154412.1 solute carrier family 40 member 3, chloroplastic isoform X3 [Oryza glaberrima]
MPASMSMSKLLSPPPPTSPPALARSSGRRVAPPPVPPFPFPLPSGNSRRRLTSRRLFATSCSSSDSDHALSTSSTALAGAGDDLSAGVLPFVQLSSGIVLRTEEQSLLGDDAPAPAPASTASSFALPDELNGGCREDDHLGETPAYPAAMNALYAACLAGNATEQLWNFTWPAAVALLHPASLLPVAVLGFFTKLVVFAAGPLVGEFISSLPRIPAYRSLAAIQTAAHLVSAATITYAFAVHRASAAEAATESLLLRPWFAVLVASTAVDRLACVALGIIAERDFVVQLAGAGRPVALAKANATLSRVDLLCETVGASIFALLLSKNDPLTCIKQSCVISLCQLPLLIFLCGEMNRLADRIFDHSENTTSHAEFTSSFSIRKTVEEAVATVRNGWSEYMRQPVLPASLAYVLVCFNVALAPGALMTTFLIHQGVRPSVIGAFGGSSAVVGILATFATARLVKELGILKAGAAGLIAQSALLGAAVVVYLTGAVSRRAGALFAFLGLIWRGWRWRAQVASRAGHMAYSAIGLQVVQTGNPASKAKLIGATEIAVASLAELAMMAVAVVASDASHFGALAALSAAAVAAATGMYCRWLSNPSDQLRRIFPS